jgi:hypothetical protein
MASSSAPFLTVLHNSEEISEAQSRFVALMTAGAKPVGSLPLGWQGGQADREVYWHPGLSLWVCFDDAAAWNRYWNAFGVGDPTDSSGTLSITVEINSPLSGINRRVAGAFARDSDGELYLMHRGKVGGGRKGIGKTAFMATYPGAISTIAEGGLTSNAIVIGRLGQPDFQASVAAFVSRVDRFKRRPSVPPARNAPLLKFSPEFIGTKSIGSRAQIEAQCRHGIVVNSLQRLLDSKGYFAGNTQHVDLQIPIDDKRVALFEVKPAADPYSVYTAIGQLYFHGTSGKDVRIAVLPSTCKPGMVRVIRKLGIRVLLYLWNGQVPAFKDLVAVLQGIPTSGSPNKR